MVGRRRKPQFGAWISSQREGVRARFPGICDSCDKSYGVGDLIAPRRGKYIHASCAPGGDDE